MASLCRRAVQPVQRFFRSTTYARGVCSRRGSSAIVSQQHQKVEVELNGASQGKRERIQEAFPCSAAASAGLVSVHRDGSDGLISTEGRRFGTFRRSSPRLEEFVMNLPNLGDSISEGTVVEWQKAVGDSVAEDEVIAVVETDKVSVDVRSAHVGVIVKLFAAIDDVVEVGKPLCTIDGDEAAVARAKEEAAAAEEDAKAPPPEVKKPKLEDAATGAFMAGADFLAPKKKKHEPLIKFIGKRSLLREQQEMSEMEELSTTPRRHRHSPGALDISQIVGSASFGRPLMSEEEMEAINSGGADSAPKLRYIDGSRWA